MTRTRTGISLLSPLLVLLLLVFIAPVVMMLPLSLRAYDPGVGITEQWTLAALLGGHKVPVGAFSTDTPYIGLDWFILDLLAAR